jgi:membrane protein involved in colicin uptake
MRAGKVSIRVVQDARSLLQGTPVTMMRVPQTKIPMATKKRARKAAPKKTARKKTPARKKATRAAAKKAAPNPLYGSITHTEFASTDPGATKAWESQSSGNPTRRVPFRT